MPSSVKSQKGKGGTTRQPSLFDCSLRDEATKTNQATTMQTDNENEPVGTKADQILAKLGSMETGFTSRLDSLAATLQDVKKEISDCSERMSHAEERISTAEDELISLQAKVNTLQAKNETMENKLMDLEARSRLNNLRLVNLPEGVEGGDICAFLEKWIPEALENEGLQPSIILERAHRIGPKNDNTSRPRTVIMRFHNYKDKQAVFTAAREKKEAYYADQQVRFYPDLATGIAQLRKKFDPVCAELRKLGIRHGVSHPATLLVTHKGKTHSFKTPAEAHVFLSRIQENLHEEETGT